MAEIFPFRGVAFNQEKIGDLSLVVTQPYDKINEALQETYYRRSDYNFVRIILNREEPGDTELHNKYTRAAEFFSNWLRVGVLQQSDVPCIYPYHQTYNLADGERRARKGFVALGKLVDYSEGSVKPHERTLAGPKADRLNLLRATKANFGQIFMLYSDPEFKIEKILTPYVAAPPPMTASAENEVVHQMWSVKDDKVIKSVQEVMADKTIFIADGHHRYETSLNFRNEMRQKGVRSEGNESIDSCMMTFINIHDKALTILPTHRLVFGIDQDRIDTMKKEMGDFFTVEKYECASAGWEAKGRQEFLQAMGERSRYAHCFGLYISGENHCLLLTLKDKSVVSKFDEGEHSQAYYELDVSILHSLLLGHFLGIDSRALEEERNIRYEREVEQAIQKVKTGDFQMAFLLSPTKVEQVEKLALRGERMPQKSTDFFPKLATGLVINKLSISD